MYTHKISWNQYESWLDMFVVKEFRTTADAVNLHVDALNRKKWDSDGNENITNIKVTEIAV